jgi:hypothetical protein
MKRVRRLRALGDPVVDAVEPDVDLLALGAGIVGAQGLNGVAVAARAGLCDDDAVVRLVGGADAGKADFECHEEEPGTLKGAAVATTAAQEFNFGPRDISNGYEPAHVEIGQPRDVVLKRMPPSDVAAAYLNRIEEVAHHFFVGDTKPETLHIVIVTRPGLRARVWLVSSIRPGNSPELDPLRKLIAAVPPLEAHEGPFILAVTGRIAGGDSREPVDDRDTRFPIPEDWRALVKGLKDPPPFSSDAFLDLLWPDSN